MFKKYTRDSISATLDRFNCDPVQILAEFAIDLNLDELLRFKCAAKLLDVVFDPDAQEDTAQKSALITDMSEVNSIRNSRIANREQGGENG